MKNISNNSILGFRYLQIYVNLNGQNISILNLVNINNMHLECALFSNENGDPKNNFEIEHYSILKNKKKLNNNISLENKETLYISKIINLYNKFAKTLNNLKNLWMKSEKSIVQVRLLLIFELYIII